VGSAPLAWRYLSAQVETGGLVLGLWYFFAIVFIAGILTGTVGLGAGFAIGWFWERYHRFRRRRRAQRADVLPEGPQILATRTESGSLGEAAVEAGAVSPPRLELVRDSGVKIRSFDESDEEQVVALWDRCGLLRSWNDPHKDIARKLRVQRDLFLVGTVDGAVVATVMGGYDGHRGWVNYLAVHPSRRRQGLGLSMIEELQRRLGELGCAKINLQIRSDNPEAISFYRRAGFTEDPVVSMGKRLERDDIG
jgi:ribosomal protein S18 acetylase RimI-like enzyme